MDYDIVVVGGGPAGLSAAVRAAWVAAPAASWRARVLVLDAGEAPGGLSRWQPLVMNSPSVIFTRRELKAMLKACALCGVEIRQERALSLAQAADGEFEVGTAGARYRAPAVIVAAGCRLGHPREHRLFHRNRILWFHDNATLDHLMRELEANDGIAGVCLVGAEAVADTRRYLHAPRRFELRVFAEPPYVGAPAPGVERGRLDAVAFDPATARLRLRFVDAGDKAQTLASDVLMVDFNAYQKSACSLGFLQLPLRRQLDGFLDAARDMSCGVPGLFSCGDVNGAPFSVIKAMSEGTIAGFGAYAHVCALRGGARPNLFPFYPYEM